MRKQKKERGRMKYENEVKGEVVFEKCPWRREYI